MGITICTLFEGNYHLGVAVLVNSLYDNGYRGSIYAGYRGELPLWAVNSNLKDVEGWKDGKTLKIKEDLLIHFLPLSTNYHLTNYKPDFMLELWNGPAKDAGGIFYFDPDIVCIEHISWFEDWIKCGVAVCEDVNSPLHQFHPRRVAWREYFSKRGKNLMFRNALYVNGGCVGVKKSDFSFLKVWKEIQEIMGEEIGGLNYSSLKGGKLLNNKKGFTYMFSKTDQDALNAAIEVYEGQISYLGKEAMAIENGHYIIPHAIGSSKPWNSNYLIKLFKGNSPRVVDREYWKFANGVVKVYPKWKAYAKLFIIKIFAFISMFYAK